MKNKKLKFEKPKEKKPLKKNPLDADIKFSATQKDKPLDGEKYNWIYWDEMGVMADNSITDRYKENKEKLKK